MLYTELETNIKDLLEISRNAAQTQISLQELAIKLTTVFRKTPDYNLDELVRFRKNINFAISDLVFSRVHRYNELLDKLNELNNILETNDEELITSFIKLGGLN